MKLIIPENSDFSIDNIPFGIFSTPERTPRAGAAIGEYIIDLFELTNDGLKVDFDRSVFLDPALNRFIALGKNITVDFRIDIQKWLKQSLWSDKDFNRFFVPQESANMHLPVQIGDYTDFYASIEHATNVGMMFRDPENALLPNWRHLPVAYHGRASSIIPSGVNIHRPKGQTMPNGAEKPVYGPSRLLDFELETAFIIGRNSDLGQQISTGEAASYIFGMVLFNDWSARDIQKWEYVPLGPFLGKNFASSISPWIVTMEALEPFRTDTPK
ncbi:MAG TPA: fumarylacetoacetate hydrolase family protein, partial [Saprospiraceae bacterium]|nr:fumarylacetoacetate hydrolase family protein [Saprospiraceae bacterium]